MDRDELERYQRAHPFAALGDAVYQSLSDDIVYLRIPPGTRLNESRLAAELGISRTPVRSALLRLADDKLVDRTEGKFSVVSPMSKEESRELYECRMAMEGYAAFLAAQRVTEEQLAQLRSSVERYGEIVARMDLRTHAQEDHAFHWLLVRAAGNRSIEHMYWCIEKRILHYRHCVLRQVEPERLQPILRQALRYHRAILWALELGFSDTARRELELDVSGMLSAFSQWEQAGGPAERGSQPDGGKGAYI